MLGADRIDEVHPQWLVLPAVVGIRVANALTPYETLSVNALQVADDDSMLSPLSSLNYLAKGWR